MIRFVLCEKGGGQRAERHGRLGVCFRQGQVTWTTEWWSAWAGPASPMAHAVLVPERNLTSYLASVRACMHQEGIKIISLHCTSAPEGMMNPRKEMSHESHSSTRGTGSKHHRPTARANRLIDMNASAGSVVMGGRRSAVAAGSHRSTDSSRQGVGFVASREDFAPG